MVSRDRTFWIKPLIDEELMEEANKVYDSLFQLNNNVDTDLEEDFDEDLEDGVIIPRAGVEENFTEDAPTKELKQLKKNHQILKSEIPLYELRNCDRRWRKKDLCEFTPEYQFSEGGDEVQHVTLLMDNIIQQTVRAISLYVCHVAEKDRRYPRDIQN
ncbi:hypothetical protein FQR65_LT09881 [Abscondita terminalis]|nr:hypothetical protein FQR65_LT09881 [Abscondita terminalis]